MQNRSEASTHPVVPSSRPSAAALRMRQVRARHRQQREQEQRMQERGDETRTTQLEQQVEDQRRRIQELERELSRSRIETLNACGNLAVLSGAL